MPLYDYECSKHGEFEAIHSINDKTPILCPRCGGKTKKLVSLFAIKWRETPMGTTREELFDNLSKEGNGGKYWRDYDTVYKHAKGIQDFDETG